MTWTQSLGFGGFTGNQSNAPSGNIVDDVFKITNEINIQNTKAFSRNNLRNENSVDIEKYRKLLESPFSEKFEYTSFDETKKSQFKSIHAVITDGTIKNEIDISLKILEDFCTKYRISDTETYALCFILKQNKQSLSLRNIENLYNDTTTMVCGLLTTFFEIQQEQSLQFADGVINDCIKLIKIQYSSNQDSLNQNALLYLLLILSDKMFLTEDQLNDLKELYLRSMEDKLNTLRMKLFLIITNTFLMTDESHNIKTSTNTFYQFFEDRRDGQFLSFLYIVLMRLERLTSKLVDIILADIFKFPNFLTEMATSPIFTYAEEISWVYPLRNLMIGFLQTLSAQNVQELVKDGHIFLAKLLDCICVIHKRKPINSLWNGPQRLFIDSLITYSLPTSQATVTLAFLSSICDSEIAAQTLANLFLQSPRELYSWENVSPTFIQVIVNRYTPSNKSKVEWLNVYLILINKIFKYNAIAIHDFLASNPTILSNLVESINSNLPLYFKATCISLITCLLKTSQTIEEFMINNFFTLQNFTTKNLPNIIRDIKSINVVYLLKSLLSFFMFIFEQYPQLIKKDLDIFTPFTKVAISVFGRLPTILQVTLQDSASLNSSESNFYVSVHRRFIKFFTILIELSNNSHIKENNNLLNQLIDLLNKNIIDSLYSTKPTVFKTIMDIFSDSSRMIDTLPHQPEHILVLLSHIRHFLLSFCKLEKNKVFVVEDVNPQQVVTEMFSRKPELIVFVLNSGFISRINEQWIELFEMITEYIPLSASNVISRDNELCSSLRTVFVRDVENTLHQRDSVVLKAIAQSLKNNVDGFALRVIVENGHIDKNLIHNLISLCSRGTVIIRESAATILYCLLRSHISQSVFSVLTPTHINTILCSLINPTAESSSITHTTNLSLLRVVNAYIRTVNSTISLDNLLGIIECYTKICNEPMSNTNTLECLQVSCCCMNYSRFNHDPVIVSLITHGINELTPYLSTTQATLNTLLMMCTLLLQHTSELPKQILNILPSTPMTPSHITLLTAYVRKSTPPQYLVEILSQLINDQTTLPLLLSLSTTLHGAQLLIRKGIFMLLKTDASLGCDEVVWRILRNISEVATPNDIESIREIVYNTPSIVTLAKIPQQFVGYERDGSITLNVSIKQLATLRDITKFITNVWGTEGDHPIIGDYLMWYVELRNYMIIGSDHKGEIKNIGNVISAEECYFNEITANAFAHISQIIIGNNNQRVFSVQYTEHYLVAFLKQFYGTVLVKLERALKARENIREKEKKKETLLNERLKEMMSKKGHLTQLKISLQFQEELKEENDLINRSILELESTVEIFKKCFSNLL
ncbi:Nucleoporin [Entamoeba marina]